MGKPLIPADLAAKLKEEDPRRTWSDVAKLLKKLGYPEDPFPAFQASSVYQSVHKGTYK
jgi:hypothetical protein